MRKILRVGDMHVQVSNIAESKLIVQLVKHTAEANGVDAIEFLGDQFNNHSVVRLEVIDFWRWAAIFLSTLEVPIIFLKGNHDICGDREKEEQISANDIFIGMKNCYVVNTWMNYGSIAYVGYTSDKAKFMEYAKKAFEDGCATTLVCHQTFNGAQYDNGFYAPEGLDPIVVPQPCVISGHIHCFSDDTEYLTNVGWKKYAEIGDDLLLVSLNKETGFLEYSKIQNRVSREVREKLYRLSTKTVDSLTTGGHTIIAKTIGNDRDISSSFSSFRADGLPGGYLKIPTAAQMNNEGIDLSDDEIRLIVWLITDGCIEKRDGKLSGLRWHFKKQRKIDRLTALFDRLGIRYSCLLQKTSKTKIRMVSDQTYTNKLLEWASVGLVKKMPEFLRGMNKRQFDVFLQEYAHTDGNFVNGTDYLIQISTQKKSEADLIQEICHINSTSCKMGIKTTVSGTYSVLFINSTRQDSELVKCRNLSLEDYKGKVNCFTVNNGTLMVRRNGCAFISGNCGQSFAKIIYPGGPRWMTSKDAEAEKGLMLCEHADDGTLLKYSMVSTAGHAERVLVYTIHEGGELPVVGVGKVYFELHGTTAWITKIKRKIPDTVRIKVFPTDTLITSKSLLGRLSMEQYLDIFLPVAGVTRPEILTCLKENHYVR